MIQPVHLRRLMAVVAFFTVIFGSLAARLVWLQVEQHDFYTAASKANINRVVFQEPPRGEILDLRGNTLAKCVPVKRLFANPRYVGSHAADIARVLAPLVGWSESLLAQALQPTVRTNAQGERVINAYVNLKRKLTLDQWQQVTQAMASLNLEPTNRKLNRTEKAFYRQLRSHAICATDDQQRVYPSGALACHVIGFAQDHETNFNERTVIQLSGRDGIESWLDPQLAGVRGWRVTKTARGVELVSQREQNVESRPGYSVVLTIDMMVQHIVEQALAEAMVKHAPTSASAIVMRPRTGEILAMATLPNFDLNRPGGALPEARRNRAISDIVEPGSTFKIVVVSGALNEHLVTLDDRFDCEHGMFHYLGRTLRDHERYGVLSVAEIITKSSNIGAAKVGLRMGEQRLYDYVRAFGFGSRTGITLPGEVFGIVHSLRNWDKLSITRIPMGQGLSVTPLQMVMAMGAIANDGRLMRPMLVKRLQEPGGRVFVEYSPQPVRQAISPLAAKDMIAALKTVVAKDGTGYKAALEHYTVAGKTGTAQKAADKAQQAAGIHGYLPGTYVASFVGFFPAGDPALCIGVFLDEPHHGYYGGQTAAPFFKTMAEQIAQYLSIRPDREEQLPEPAPAQPAELNTVAVGEKH
jgi:cell division protein FtsI/penicillin-binding protein 2